MSELDDFLIPTLTRQLEAEQALINGDPGPRLAMWSSNGEWKIVHRHADAAPTGQPSPADVSTEQASRAG
jgi:hypothetical protein